MSAGRATVMFNGSLYGGGEVVRETDARLLVRFTVPSSGVTREKWFTKVNPPPTGTVLLSRRSYRAGDGHVTIPANSAFIEEAS